MRRTTVLASIVLSLSFCAPAFSGSKVSQQLSQRLPELRFQGVTFGDAIEFLRDVSGTNMTVNWRALEAAGVSKDTPINIHLAGITLRKALDMVLNDAAGGDAITYFVDQGVIEITTRDIADHNMVTRVYPVEDLLMEIPDFTDAPSFSLDQSQSSGGGGGGGQPLGQGGGGGGQINVSNQLFQNANQNGQNNRNQGKTKAERAQDLVDLIQAIIYPDIWKDNGGTASIRYFNGMLVVTAPRSVQEAIGGEYD
jgi:hypothetical protein